MAVRLRGSEEGQGGLIVLVLSLLVVGVLTAIVLGSTLGGGSNSPADNPTVGLASDVQAKTSLSEAVTAAQAALTAGGSVSAAGLAAANPSLQYTTGPSTGPDLVSVTPSAGSGGAIPGAGGVTVPGSPATGGSGVVLAVHSSSANCWFAYLGGPVPWYGEQTGQPSCTAPALSGTPTAGPVSSSSIGWQMGSFPAP
jgi:hypothetical protein